MNPFIIEDSRERYQDRLNEAEEWQLAKRARPNRVNPVARLRGRLGDHLLALGQYLKAAAQPEPQFDEAPPA